MVNEFTRGMYELIVDAGSRLRPEERPFFVVGIAPVIRHIRPVLRYAIAKALQVNLSDLPREAAWFARWLDGSAAGDVAKCREAEHELELAGLRDAALAAHWATVSIGQTLVLITDKQDDTAATIH